MTSFLGTDPWKSEGRMGDLLPNRNFFSPPLPLQDFFPGHAPLRTFLGEQGGWWGVGGKNWRAKCSATPILILTPTTSQIQALFHFSF